MKTLLQTVKPLLDAVAFANAGNLGEFRAMLHRVERPADPLNKPSSDDALPPPPRVAVLPATQGAM